MNTEIAHQQYANPLIGVIVLLHRGEKIAVFKQQNDTWGLPEEFACGNEYVEGAVYRILYKYLLNGRDAKIESCTLLSGKSYRKDAYQFNYIAYASINRPKIKSGNQMKWITKEDMDSDIYPNHKKILEKHFQKAIKDEIIVPNNPLEQLECSGKRLKKNREIHAEHAEHFPMPSIAVDGLLLKFSKEYKFKGLILEKRSKNAKREPGKWALPAGFVYAYETVSEALARKVFEEIGVTLKENQFLSTYKGVTDPDRDPEYFVWTQLLIFYTMEEPKIASAEVEDVKVFPVGELPWGEMAFDHGDILREFIKFIPRYVREALDEITL